MLKLATAKDQDQADSGLGSLNGTAEYHIRSLRIFRTRSSAEPALIPVSRRLAGRLSFVMSAGAGRLMPALLLVVVPMLAFGRSKVRLIPVLVV